MRVFFSSSQQNNELRHQAISPVCDGRLQLVCSTVQSGDNVMGATKEATTDDESFVGDTRCKTGTNDSDWKGEIHFVLSISMSYTIIIHMCVCVCR